MEKNNAAIMTAAEAFHELERNHHMTKAGGATKPKTVPFSIKVKPEDKAELEAYLKHVAAVKGITQGEALVFAFSTLKTYGELPRVIEKGFQEFTTETARMLSDIRRVMMLVGNAEASSNTELNADQISDDFDADLVFEEIPVSDTDADREPTVTRIGTKHWKPPFKGRRA